MKFQTTFPERGRTTRRRETSRQADVSISSRWTSHVVILHLLASKYKQESTNERDDGSEWCGGMRRQQPTKIGRKNNRKRNRNNGRSRPSLSLSRSGAVVGVFLSCLEGWMDGFAVFRLVYDDSIDSMRWNSDGDGGICKMDKTY